MISATQPPAKLQHTAIDPSVRLRDTQIGQQCEILAHSYLEYSELGDFSYLGEHCCVADAQIAASRPSPIRCVSGHRIIRWIAPHSIASPTARSITTAARSAMPVSSPDAVPIE